LRETADLPCDRVHGMSKAVEVVVDESGGAVEEERPDGGGVRPPRRAFGFVSSLVVEQAWAW
jgi:hypothetical protein